MRKKRFLGIGIPLVVLLSVFFLATACQRGSPALEEHTDAAPVQFTKVQDDTEGYGHHAWGISLANFLEEVALDKEKNPSDYPEEGGTYTNPITNFRGT